MTGSPVRVAGDEIRFEVRVVPRASRSEIGEWDAAGRLKVRVASPPVDGAANDALREIFAARFDVPARQIRLVRGEAGREKTLAVKGISLDRFMEILGRPSSSDSGGRPA